MSRVNLISSSLVVGWLVVQPSLSLAASYYVATNGSDSYTSVQAQNVATPWLTISKAAGVMVAGDTCYIRGGTYRRTVTPANSGTAALPITYRPYSNEVVTVSGADVVTGWSVYSNGIYQAALTGALGDKDQVFVDGVMMNLARWPNTSLDVSRPVKAVADSGSYALTNNPDGTRTGTYTDAALTQPAGVFVGAKIHTVPGVVWVAQTGTVTNYSPGFLEFRWKINGTTNTYAPKVGDPYFLFGLLSLLDTPGEWFINPSANRLYLWPPQNDSPTNHTVEAKKRDYGFDLSGKSYITLQGLRLFACAVNSSSTSRGLVLDGLDCAYVNHFALIDTAGPWSYHMNDTGLILNGTNNILRNSHIAFSAGNGVTLLGVSNLVDNCVIHDVNYADLDCAAINTGLSATSKANEIRYNTCFNSGRGLLLLRSLTAGKVHHNVLYRSMLRTTDGGAMYSFAHDGLNTEIAYNLVCDNMCPGKGSGIYLDNQSTNFITHHNLIYNTGLALHYNLHSVNMKWFNNTAVAFNESWTGGFSDGRSQAGSELRNNICTATVKIATTNLAEVVRSNNLTNNVNPLFVSTNALNFQLQAGSPCVDAGIAISPYTDGFSGAAPDIGAFEYGQPPWTAGSTLTNFLPPAGPNNLNATVIAGGRVQLTWSVNATNETQYVVDGSFDNQTYTELAYLPANTTSYTDVVASVSYYRVRAGESLNSNYRAVAGGRRDPFSLIQAESLSAQSGLTVGGSIGSCDNNDWAKYANVDFGAGATNGTASVAVPALYAGKNVEFRLDSTTGPVIGILTVADTGSFGTFSNQVFTVTNATGVHDLYLLFKGGSGVCNMDYFKFSALSPRPGPPVPQSVAAVPGVPSSVQVTWAATNGQEGFKIERATDNQNFVEIGTASSNSFAFTDAGVPSGSSFYYRVRSYNLLGNSDYSASVATTTLSVPSIPPSFPPGGIKLLPGGGISLVATGAINAPYRIWGTSNLALPMNNWTVLVSNSISASPFTNLDLIATNQSQRFYRFSNP